VRFPTDIQEISDYLTQQLMDRNCKERQCIGMAIRATPSEFAANPTSGEGSLIAGGRFNIKRDRNRPYLPEGIRAIYLADSHDTVLREARLLIQTADGENLIDDDDYEYFVIRYKLNRVIDLTEGDIFDYQLLTGVWTEYYSIRNQASPTQRIAIAAFNLGIQALKVPSSQNLKGYNLVIFSDNLDDKCSITVDRVSRGQESSE
jgi:RES domain-containing protein